MARRRAREINLPAPYLKRLWLDPAWIQNREAYPFCLPFLTDDFELRFERAITIIVGENGTGKSTLLEGIAALSGYDQAGGGKGYRPVDHSAAAEVTGGELSGALRASWLPRITRGWFFRAGRGPVERSSQVGAMGRRGRCGSSVHRPGNCAPRTTAAPGCSTAMASALRRATTAA